ncbi:MAG: hypothetical protein MN733_14050 [Nitrososphaera sp.]|nr:hypothetical protein [Nitrososphaera sp.]
MFMRPVYFVVFFRSAIVILITTAVIKIASAFGSSEVLGTIDPLFGITRRNMLWLVAAIELSTAWATFRVPSEWTKAYLLLVLSMNFLMYRVVILLLPDSRPCVCLGTISQWLPIRPAIVEFVAKSCLVYLFCGSFYVLVRHWIVHKRGPRNELSMRPS